MSQARRSTFGWLMLTVTVLCFFLLSMPDASTEGRDFSRCIHSCNAARQNCTDLCQSQCNTLFPGSDQQRRACVMDCKESCLTTEQECKTTCRAIKNGTSPNDPT